MSWVAWQSDLHGCSHLIPGCCCSTWVMLNTSTRKVAKIPDKMRHKLDNLAPHPFRCPDVPSVVRHALSSLRLYRQSSVVGQSWHYTTPGMQSQAAVLHESCHVHAVVLATARMQLCNVMGVT